ncbi:MAG: hypothetical protein AB7E37_05755 [Candidatus Altimarinota bacterium]
MTKKLLLLIILAIFFISFTTLFFIFNYLDPYRNEMVSVVTLTISFSLCITSFVSMILYIFKKVYYRGEIFLIHIFSSLRQAFLISMFLVGIVLFKIIGVFSIATVGLFILILIFIEMMFQNF